MGPPVLATRVAKREVLQKGLVEPGGKGEEALYLQEVSSKGLEGEALLLLK